MVQRNKKRTKKEKAKNRDTKSHRNAHRRKYRQPYSNERVLVKDRLSSAYFSITYDPPGDGNCQFSVICKSLSKIGVFRSTTTSREAIVEYLKAHPHMQEFTDVAWSTYLQHMAQDGTYGDHLTLRAAANIYNVQFTVISSLGPAGTQVISPIHAIPFCNFYIGHFAKGDGEHYVVLQNDFEWDVDLHRNEQSLPQTSEPFSQNSSQGLFHSHPNTILNNDGNRKEKLHNLEIHQNDQSPLNEEVRNTAHDQRHTDPSMDNNDHMPDRPTSQENLIHRQSEQNPGQLLNPDVLEYIIIQTVTTFPFMRQTLRAVSRFFRLTVDNQPLPQIYIPELKDFYSQRVSVRKIMSLKGKLSATVIELRQIINHSKWMSAWLTLVKQAHGWYIISLIWWKPAKK